MKTKTQIWFEEFIEQHGSLFVLSNLAEYFDNDTDVYEDWEKEYYLDEANRLFAAIQKLSSE